MYSKLTIETTANLNPFQQNSCFTVGLKYLLTRDLSRVRKICHSDNSFTQQAIACSKLLKKADL